MLTFFPLRFRRDFLSLLSAIGVEVGSINCHKNYFRSFRCLVMSCQKRRPFQVVNSKDALKQSLLLRKLNYVTSNAHPSCEDIPFVVAARHRLFRCIIRLSTNQKLNPDLCCLCLVTKLLSLIHNILAGKLKRKWRKYFSNQRPKLASICFLLSLPNRR